MIPGFLAKVETMACLVPGLLGVHHLRAEYIGPDTIHAGMHIVVQHGSESFERMDTKMGSFQEEANKTIGRRKDHERSHL